MPRWLVLSFGLALGAAGVLIGQLVWKRGGAGDGLAGLFTRSQPESAVVKKSPEPVVPAKPRFDFYTVLPGETVLPERGRARPKAEADYFLQAGAFSSYSEADALKARLALHGLIAEIQNVEIDGKIFHRVRVGPYPRIEQLDAAAVRLERLGVRALRVQAKKNAG